MSVEERGRLPSRWTQLWFGAIHWLSCGLCSRNSTVSALPVSSEDSSVKSPKLQEIQKMQPGVLCLTDLYTRAHSTGEIQPDAMSLMDLNDDCLLKIINRLDFEDRLRFRVNRRLKALEPAAVAIANTEHRMECEVLHCQVNEDRQVVFELEPSRFGWSSPLPLESGLLMFIRAIKCCRFNFVTLTLPLDIDDMAEVFKSLRFMKTEYFTFIPIGTHYPEDHSQHIVTGIISAFRNNELFKDARFEHAQTWASSNQLLTLIQVEYCTSEKYDDQEIPFLLPIPVDQNNLRGVEAQGINDHSSLVDNATHFDNAKNYSEYIREISVRKLLKEYRAGMKTNTSKNNPETRFTTDDTSLNSYDASTVEIENFKFVLAQAPIHSNLIVPFWQMVYYGKFDIIIYLEGAGKKFNMKPTFCPLEEDSTLDYGMPEIINQSTAHTRMCNR